MLSGQAVLDTRWAFEQVLGESTVRRALEGLPASIRTTYEATTALTWVPYAVLRSVHDAYGREAGVPVEMLLERVVPLAMERSFSTVWRVFLRFTGDDALMARAPLVYSRSRNKGTMTARRTAPGEGICELADWPGIPARDVHALGISIRHFMTLAGRERVAVHGEKTRDGARWRVRWKV